MRYLRTNTAQRITVGPFFDKTDGITPKTALTVTNCKLTFIVDDGNVPTLVLDTNPTASGGANDMVHVTGDDAGFYDLELAAANVNYLGRAMIALTDAANHCPVFHEFMIVPAMIYDSMILGTDDLDTNTKKWNDLTTVALPLVPATAGRTLVVDAAGLADANVVKVGPTGAGTAQTARDIGASVLISPGTGVGQLNVASGVVDANTIKVSGTSQTAGDLAALLVTIAAYIDTEVGAIKTQTDKMVFTVANQLDVNVLDWKSAAAPAMSGDAFARLGAPAGASIAADLAVIVAYLDTEIAAIKAKTDNLPSDPADASDIAASFASIASTLSTIAAYIDTEVAAIKAKTDNLPSDPADASDISAAFSSISFSLTTIAGYIDTEVAAIKAKTDNIPSDPADASDIAASFSGITSTLSAIQTLADELHKIQGLNASAPMTVTPTSRVAGTITQVISGNGVTSSVVTRS